MGKLQPGLHVDRDGRRARFVAANGYRETITGTPEAVQRELLKLVPAWLGVAEAKPEEAETARSLRNWLEG